MADNEGRALRGYKVARARSAVGAGRARGLVQRRRAHRDHGRDFDPIFGPSAGLMITVIVPENGEKMVKNRDFSALKAPGPGPRCARTTWYPRLTRAPGMASRVGPGTRKLASWEKGGLSPARRCTSGNRCGAEISESTTCTAQPAPPHLDARYFSDSQTTDTTQHLNKPSSVLTTGKAVAGPCSSVESDYHPSSRHARDNYLHSKPKHASCCQTVQFPVEPIARFDTSKQFGVIDVPVHPTTVRAFGKPATRRCPRST